MMLLRSGAPIILAAALAGAVPSAAQDAQKDLTEGVSEATPAAELFMRAYEVFSHPRCSNCHPRDDRPRWGPARQVHGMNVQRGEERGDPHKGGYGRVGMNCATCHRDTNGKLLNSPPGAEHWRLAPPEMGWAGMTAAELCMQLKSLKSPDDPIEHIVNPEKRDPLVAWAWKPGPGRERAPGTLDQFVNVLRWWNDGGAGCPSM